MYVFGGEQAIAGDIATIWAVWTDMPRFPDWDPVRSRPGSTARSSRAPAATQSSGATPAAPSPS